MIRLNALNPLLHTNYSAVMQWLPSNGSDLLPSDVRERVSRLIKERNIAPEDEIDLIDRQLVTETYWYVLRPDEIARRTMCHHKLRSPLSIEQAALVLIAIAEAGYPIWGNGAPNFVHHDCPAPISGQERDHVIWDAAHYWAVAASHPITYVSLGDYRGYLPRRVQYDNPGSMHPSQRAAVTFGPEVDRGDSCDSPGYMHSHTRRLILVKED